MNPPTGTAPERLQESLFGVVEKLLLKNRTIVSSDNVHSLSVLGEVVPLVLHRYPTGAEYGTWVVPPRWDVKRALLSDGEKILASAQDHPLFLAPYSAPFTGWVSRQELDAHVITRPEMPDVFPYEYRLAYDYSRRLKDWVIALPYALVERLNGSRYFVDIEVETSPGELLVGESFHPGRSQATFCLLSHLCHPGQANDGLAGVAVGVEAMRRIREEFPHPRLSYQLLVLPETIGSAVYLASHEEKIPSYLGGLFLEMAGIRSPLRYGGTRRGDTYIDRVMREALTQHGAPFSECSFLESWGNDERVFDSPGIGIPTGSLERHPYRWYHTSGDDLSQTDPGSLEEMVEVVMAAVRIMEADFIPRPVSRIPIYLTRYRLYADWEQQREDYDSRARIMDLFWKGLSVFDISQRVALPYAKVRAFVAQFVEHRLVEEDPVTPEYARREWARLDAGS